MKPRGCHRTAGMGGTQAQVLHRFLFLSFFLLLAGAGQGQETVFSASGQSNPLGNTNPFARSAAMGSAFVGVADDASALFTNPAGLGFLRKGQLALNSDFWLVNTVQETILLSLPLRRLGGFALAGHYLDYGSFDGRDSAGSITTPYSADRLGLEAGWGVEAFRDFAVGLALQGAQAHLAGMPYTSMALGFGVLWKGPSRFQLGAACGDIGLVSPSGTSEAALNLGASYEIVLDPDNRLLAAVSGTLEPDAVDYFQAGVEFGLLRKLFLRLGWDQPLSDTAIPGLAALTAGVGVSLDDFRFDYAYLPYGDLGVSHRISVGYLFGTAPPGMPASARGKLPPESGEGTSFTFSRRTPPHSAGPSASPGSRSLTGTAPAILPGGAGNKPATQNPAAGPWSAGAPPGSASPGAGIIGAEKSLSPFTATQANSQGNAGAGEATGALPQPVASATPADSLVVQFDLPDNSTPVPGQTPSAADLEKDGKYREAARAYQDAVQRNPGDAASWWALGDLYLRFHQKASAVRCFERVLELEPGNRKLADWLEQYKDSNP